MYNNIAEFREFIIDADDEQIEKVVHYINEVGILAGRESISEYNKHLILKHAIEFANSSYEYTEDFLIARVGVNVED